MALPGISRWANRVALVTGASSGIGAAICNNLVKNGMTVVGCARNKEPIDALTAKFIQLGYPGKLLSFKCDVSKEDEIEKMFEWIKSTVGGVDVCINSAGYSRKESLLDISAQQMRDMLDVNVVGLVLCTSKAVKSMKERGVNDGHIFHLNSMSGHRLTGILNFYAATKFAVTALTEGFRRELVEDSKIKVTSISPGLVETEFLVRAFEDQAMAKSVYARADTMKPEDIADIILFILSAPPNVQVHDILLRPTGDRI